jgi:hypothetical protein
MCDLSILPLSVGVLDLINQITHCRKVFIVAVVNEMGWRNFLHTLHMTKETYQK